MKLASWPWIAYGILCIIVGLALLVLAASPELNRHLNSGPHTPACIAYIALSTFLFILAGCFWIEYRNEVKRERISNASQEHKTASK